MAKETRPKGYPKLRNYKPSKFMLETSHYDKTKADRAVRFIENLCHTKGKWAGKRFWLLPWQEQLIQDIFGIVKPDGNRQFRTAFVEICKKVGKSELAAAVALYLLYADNEPSAEVYGAAADRQQASIVFDVARQMVEIPIIVGVEMSFFTHKIQGWIHEYCTAVRIPKWNELAELRSGVPQKDITRENLFEYLNGKKAVPDAPEKIVFTRRKLNQYFPKYMSTPERERIIISLLEKWKEEQDNKRQ